jgi:hypothetical protein
MPLQSLSEAIQTFETARREDRFGSTSRFGMRCGSRIWQRLEKPNPGILNGVASDVKTASFIIESIV